MVKLEFNICIFIFPLVESPEKSPKIWKVESIFFKLDSVSIITCEKTLFSINMLDMVKKIFFIL